MCVGFLAYAMHICLQVTFPYAWQPSIIPVQILRVGQMIITALPGEFTTMSGRRIRKALTQVCFDWSHTLLCVYVLSNN